MSVDGGATSMRRGLRRPSAGLGLLALGLLLLGVALARLMVGRDLGGIPTFDWPSDDVRSLRLTALVSAAAVGACLGVSGALLQAILRNPLADPFILGVSGGAGLAVTIAGALAWAWGAAAPTWLAGGGLVLPATAGGLAALAITQLLGWRRGGPDPLALVLAGVAISAMCGALILFVQHLVPHGVRGDLATWMMGRVPEVVDRTLLGAVVVVALGGVGIAAASGRALDVALLGDDDARSIGLALGRLRLVHAMVAGVLAAAAVALAGPLAFVGLMAPHAARLLLGARHRPLAVGAAMMGAAVLVGADVLRQLIDFGAGRVPVGVFTALAGGPVFLWLLRTGKGAA